MEFQNALTIPTREIATHVLADHSCKYHFFSFTPRTILAKNAHLSSCQESRECINDALVCDGTQDCKDGSDENEQTCRKFPLLSLLHKRIIYAVVSCSLLIKE